MSFRQDANFMDYERSMRSCFVGNIPYEATEEELKDIFSEVGTVASFRLVYDRDSGKPKGYGFAEFADQETALSAMRNLNSRELHGRTLRVDHATNDKIRPTGYPFGGPDDDMFPAAQPPPPENPYGEAVPAKEAPEAISKAVASLPPEQMFELMKQMKQCIQNNPVEARNMLLQNPQLAYALLQAQVVMKIVDPEIAMKMLHRQSPVPPPVLNEHEPERMDTRANGDGHQFNPDRNMRPVEPPVDRMDPRIGAGGPNMGRGSPHDIGRGGPPQMVPPPGPMDRGPPQRRGMDPNRSGMDQGRMDMGPNRPGIDQGRMNMGPNRPGMMPNRPGMDQKPPDMGPMRPSMNRPGMDNRGPGPMPNDRTSLERENQQDKSSDPRRPNVSRPPASGPEPGALPVDTQDQEKAALIMQVLQLTPEQIALLPEEQRKSILILKEQIQGGGA